MVMVEAVLLCCCGAEFSTTTQKPYGGDGFLSRPWKAEKEQRF
jgi:hypothetical protein